MFTRRATSLMARLNGDSPIARIVYSDRYLRSPLSVRLLAETLGHLATLKGGVTKSCMIEVRTTFDERSGSYGGLTGNWPTAERQKLVTEALLLKVTGASVKVELPRVKLPHYRFLKLEWADGKKAEIRLDQGLSGMQVAGRPLAFDTSKATAEQAEALHRVTAQLEPFPPGAAPIYIVQP